MKTINLQKIKLLINSILPPPPPPPTIKLFVLALCSWFGSFSAFRQGQSCQNPISIPLTNQYQDYFLDMTELQNLYVSFNPPDTIAYFDVSSTTEYPQKINLYETNCNSNPIFVSNLFIDSTNTHFLSLEYFGLDTNSTYILEFEQNNNNSVTTFNLNATVDVLPNGPPLCNQVYNGSFEAVTPGAPLEDLNQEIIQSHGWQAPNYNGSILPIYPSYVNRTDYYNVNSSDTRYQVPSNQVGNTAAVNDFDGNGAYAGLFAVNTTLNNKYQPGQFREWMMTTFAYPLQAGTKYRVTYYVHLSTHNHINDASVAPGIKFTTQPTTNLTQIQIIALTADVQSDEIIDQSDRWVKCTAVYTAQGGEKYLTVANFKTDNQSLPAAQIGTTNKSYFLVDGISVTKLGYCCPNPTLEIQDGWDVSDLLASNDFAPYITGTTLDVGEQIQVNGSFTINSDFTIRNANLLMSKDGEIEINAGKKLTIEESILDVCGDDMWNGISILNNSAELVFDHSSIWSAKRAIESKNGGKYTVSNSTFDGNYYGIFIDAHQGTHDGTVSGSTFKSSFLLLSPHFGGRSLAGIYLNEVVNTGAGGTELKIGDENMGKNNFYGPVIDADVTPLSPGLQYGIYSYKSSAVIYNNVFTRFSVNPYQDPQQQSSIYLVGLTNNNYYNGYFPTVTVGGDATNKKNYFYSTSNAIDMYGIMNAFIHNNEVDFPFNYYTNYQYEFPISSENNSYLAKLEIIDNSISGVNNGIEVRNNQEMDYMKINSNTITMSGVDYTMGIFLYNASAEFSFQVKDNIISEGNIGIDVIGGAVLNGFVPQITGNEIDIFKTSSGLTQNKGIAVYDALNFPGSQWTSEISENNISSSAASISTIYGINSQLNNGTFPITCNYIEKTATAMCFSGVINTAPSQFAQTPIYRNVMKNNEDCFVLTNNSNLQRVGDYNLPADNKWDISNTGYDTYTDISTNGNLTTIYTRGGGLPYQPVTNGSAGFSPILINSSASGAYLDCVGGPPSPPMGLSMSTQGSYDSLPDFMTEYPNDTTRWLAEYLYYRALPADSNIQNKTVQLYKDSVKNSPLGNLLAWNKVDSNATSLSARNTKVKAVSTNNAFEANIKTVLDYEMTAQLEAWDTLSTTVFTDLEVLAEACPFKAGPAVYSARALLKHFTGKHYYNVCEGYTTTAKVSKRVKSTAEKAVEAVLVYPNPVHTELTVGIQLDKQELARFQLFDINARKLLDQRLNNGQNNVAVDQLPSGIYLYKVFKNNQLLKTEKLIIQ